MRSTETCLYAEKAAALALCAGAIAGPVALGATGPWARLAIEGTVAIAVALWATASPRRRLPAIMPLAFAALFCLQLLPLPDRVLGFIAPVASGAWKVARTGLDQGWATVSVDPAVTATAIWRMLLVLAALAATTSLCCHAWCRKAFRVALSLACVSMWTLGIVFPFDKSLVLLGFIDCRGPIEAEFWKTPLVPPIATNGSGNLDWVTVAGQRYATAMWIAADGFGPYIYANHFAGAMCLTVPTLLGGMFTVARDRLPAFVRMALASTVFAAALWTVGVMATSRAGAGALLLGALVFFSLTLEAGWARTLARTATVLYAVMLLIFTLSMYGAFSGIERLLPTALQPRLTALLSDARTFAGRVAFRMFAASPVLGVGLGTYGELFTRFSRGDAVLGYAHNDYAQWLAETGLVGLAVASAVACQLVLGLGRYLNAGDRADRALPAGAWAGLAALGVHSAFDWNLHIPANALLACMVAGLAGASSQDSSAPAKRAAGKGPVVAERWPGWALAVACLFSLVFLARDAMSETTQRRLREAIVAARLQTMDATRPPTSPDLRAAIETGERMVGWDSRNSQLATLIGQAYLHLSTEQQPIDDASKQMAAANRWFATARAHCAAARGVPEPLNAVKLPDVP